MKSFMNDINISTLVNNWQIQLIKNYTWLFEVGNLKYASSVTISRCDIMSDGLNSKKDQKIQF
jgi:hypothetical protein